MKNRELTEDEKLNAVKNWALGVKAFFKRQNNEIIKVSKDEMIEKFQEVLDILGRVTK